MKIHGSVINEQGVTFAIVVMKMSVVQSEEESAQAVKSLGQIFPNIPIVLMGQDDKGTPSYRGRPDIVDFLASIDMDQIPWKEYTITQ